MRDVWARRAAARLPARLLYHLDRVGPDRDASWDEVTAALQRRSPRVVGFDVYDTLLLRDLNDQDALRSVVASRLCGSGAWSGTSDEYLDARREALQQFPGEGLPAWYRHPALASRSDVDRCVEAEIELERTITTAVPGAVEALDRLRAAGVRIAFLSDMHLPSAVISGLLDDHDLRAGDETVLVSGDVGRWKSDGGLFRFWLAAEGLEPTEVAYVGNHPFADCAVPRSLGLAASPRRSGNPVRYEELLGRSGTAGAVVAAASTRARMTADAPDDVAVEVGAAVAGQAMMAFLLAIRARCRAEDLRQVVFVARDGDLLFQMAGEMPKDYWSSVELHYVHGNRLTWTLAGAHTRGVQPWISSGTADQHSFLRFGSTTTPLEVLVARLGLGLGELPADLVRGAAPSRPPEPEQWSAILADERVHELISARASERYGLVFEYLAGLGLRPEPSLVVDIGWRGQSAAAVSPLLTSVLGVEPINYHFGGYGVQPDIDADCTIERYAFDDSVAPAPFAGVDQCVETFTGAGQPRAVGYQRLGPSVLPRFDEGLSRLAAGERATIWRLARRLAELMPPAERVDEWTSEPPDPEAVCALLGAFWTEPRPAEGRMASGLLIETDDAGRSIVPVTSPYRLRELLTRRRSPRQWRQGSMAASAPPIRTLARMLHLG